MNEHIKKLFDRALDQAVPETWTTLSHEQITKLSEVFAELIVRECMSIVKSNTYGPNGEYDYSYSDESAAADERAEIIYKDISHRFGVEE
jgi:hypothetical protein